jgi:hypothetical protein
MRARYGINRAYALMHNLFSLIAGTGRSEFVDLENPTFASGDLRIHNALENLDLGIVGSLLGSQRRRIRRGDIARSSSRSSAFRWHGAPM